MERSAGVILPISALPSPYGIGTLGQASRDFIDFLAESGQRVWQLLPVGPTGYGDSPYQTFSAFAGNPYFIDLDLLRRQGLLTTEEIGTDWGNDPRRVDYGTVYRRRFDVLRLACDRLRAAEPEALDAFRAENRCWLPDYALFMAIKRHYGMRDWRRWPNEKLRLRDGGALARWREKLSEDVLFFETVQLLFFRQWDALRAYARERNIRLMGDVPIYTAMDSSDVWSAPENYQLDECRRPTAVAGVPPDYFSADGQLWGNPLYNWSRMRRDGYAWWCARLKSAAKLFDMVRIDHFRGFVSYWAVPYGQKTAKRGRWMPGPGLALLEALRRNVPELDIVAEDLGLLTPAVYALLEKSGLPGMKVLEFAFGGRNNPYLPHKYNENCICYTGTHDNAPLAGWIETEPEAAERAWSYLHRPEDLHKALMEAGLQSRANLFVAQLQDWLGLGAQARMNIPGTVGGNWCWRLLPGETTAALAQRMRAATRGADR